MPANSGLASEVPPMRYSEYFADPSGKVWVSPTRMPVFGSPRAATSGSARPPDAEYRFAMDAGTTPRWYAGWEKTRLVPPPPPYRWSPGGVGDQAPLVSVEREVLHPVSKVRLSFLPTPSAVPPTAVTRGLLAGAWTVGTPLLSTAPSPESPEEKYIPMPSRAAWKKICW